MKATGNKMFHVGLFFTTSTGRAGAKNYTIGGVRSEKEAIRKAENQLTEGKGSRFTIKGSEAVEFHIN